MRGAERLDHCGQIVVRTSAERAGAEGDAVGLHVDRVQHMAVVGKRRHDARQAEQRKRRIVGMAAQVDAEAAGMRRHLGQEIGQVLAQFVRTYAVIGRQMRLQRVERPVLLRARQPGDDVRGEPFLARLVHPRNTPRRFRRHLAGIALRGALALQHMDVEGGEIGEVEAHRPAAIRQRPGKLGARPVEHRHEIVADGPDAGPRQVFEAAAIVDDMRPPLAGLRLDRLGDRQALDDVPGEMRHRAVGMEGHLALALLDLLRRPHRAGRDVMQRRDDAFDAGLPGIGQRHLVDRAEPAPGLLHG